MSSESFDVVCSGIIVVDHVAAPIDRLPDSGELVLTDDCLLAIGGCASNVAVDLQKMNVATAVNGCVGDDPFGMFAKQFLNNRGVGTTHLHTVGSVATSQTLIVNVIGQDRRFIHHLGASEVFSATHFPMEQILAAKVLYLGGYFLLDNLVATDLAGVFRRARQAGVKTILDVVTPGQLDYKGPLSVVLPETDFFLPNDDEAKLILGEADPLKQADAFRDLGAETVVITCGTEGSYLVSPDERLHAGTFAVDFVDGTGGGDAFTAGFISGLLENADLRRSLTLGSALGASCVQQSGATEGVFTRDEADKFLANNEITIKAV